MKFECDRCHTRYSIGDEKVRGKVLKIRCKTCSNIIVVREQSAITEQAPSVAAQGGSSSSSQVVRNHAPPEPSSTSRGDDVDWFVAIKGKQHGPSKAEEVMRLYREGKITERTYCWNEGLSAWTRLRELPEFMHLMSEAPQKRAAPPPPPVEESTGHGAEVVSLDQARQQRQARESGNSLEPPRSSPVPSNPGPMIGDPFASLGGLQAHTGDAPRESTRVFIMQAGLANRGKKHKLYGMIAAICGSVFVLAAVLDYTGAIEIPGLHGVIAATGIKKADDGPKWGETWGSEGTGDESAACKLRGDCPPPKVANRGPRPRRAPAGGGGGALTDMDIGTNTLPDEAGLGTRVGVDANGLAAPTIGGIASVFKGDQKIMATVKDRSAGTPAVAGGDRDAESIAKVVKGGMSAVQSCVEQGAKNGQSISGKQYLTLTIQPNGIVSTASFKNIATAATPVGECITKAAKKWKFAPTGGKEATDVDIPLSLAVM
jgi:predicted Zn finger-like uncharacterized protein